MIETLFGDVPASIEDRFLSDLYLIDHYHVWSIGSILQKAPRAITLIDKFSLPWGNGLGSGQKWSYGNHTGNGHGLVNRPYQLVVAHGGGTGEIIFAMGWGY